MYPKYRAIPARHAADDAAKRKGGDVKSLRRCAIRIDCCSSNCGVGVGLAAADTAAGGAGGAVVLARGGSWCWNWNWN